MTILLEEHQNVMVLRPEGHALDARNAEQFRDSVRPIISSHSKIVLDMSQIRFVDSAGLGALLSLMRGLASQNGQLRLVGLQDEVLTMFRQIRMNMVFEIYDSVQQATETWYR